MDLNDIALFERVVRERGFTAAAKALGLAKSTLSTRIRRLEERLGTRLLERTTRSFALTDAGAAYYEHCRQIVAEALEAERAVQTLETEPAGRLRVSAPTVLADRILAPLTLELLERYPALRVEMIVTERWVEPAREGLDVAVLLDPKDDPTVRSRPLGHFALYPVASPRFIARHGRPEEPADLVRFRCIAAAADERWQFGDAQVSIQPVLAVNRWEVARRAAIAGLGIARLPVFMWQTDYERSELLPVLGPASAGESEAVARYRSARYSHPAVRAFLDRLSSTFAALEPWPRGA